MHNFIHFQENHHNHLMKRGNSESPLHLSLSLAFFHVLCFPSSVSSRHALSCHVPLLSLLSPFSCRQHFLPLSVPSCKFTVTFILSISQSNLGISLYLYVCSSTCCTQGLEPGFFRSRTTPSCPLFWLTWHVMFCSPSPLHSPSSLLKEIRRDEEEICLSPVVSWKKKKAKKRKERANQLMGIMCNNLFPPLLPVSLIDSQDTQITGFIRYMFVWLRFHSFRSLLVNTHTLYHMKRGKPENLLLLHSLSLVRCFECLCFPTIYFFPASPSPEVNTPAAKPPQTDD